MGFLHHIHWISGSAYTLKTLNPLLTPVGKSYFTFSDSFLSKISENLSQVIPGKYFFWWSNNALHQSLVSVITLSCTKCILNSAVTVLIICQACQELSHSHTLHSISSDRVLYFVQMGPSWTLLLLLVFNSSIKSYRLLFELTPKSRVTWAHWVIWCCASKLVCVLFN